MFFMAKKTTWGEPFYSKLLDMNISQNKISGDVLTEDKVLYTRHEMKIMKSKNIDVSPELHTIKKVFGCMGRNINEGAQIIE